ncbi:hypothetical protein [Scytonema millei]|uniref:hypothetical protein n=1 Tax=Scytonema millei TaxID=1245922 RepID=UPI000A61BA42|nr:hypothetical protein [Scytonema millei]
MRGRGRYGGQGGQGGQGSRGAEEQRSNYQLPTTNSLHPKPHTPHPFFTGH